MNSLIQFFHGKHPNHKKFKTYQEGSSFIDYGLIHRDLLEKIENIKKHNIRVDIRSIFLQGLLLQGKESAINLFPNFHAEISSWHDYCKYNKLSLLEASILNVLNLYEGKSLILFGCRSLNEIEEILDALSADNKLTNNFVSYFSNNLTDPRLWNK